MASSGVTASRRRLGDRHERQPGFDGTSASRRAGCASPPPPPLPPPAPRPSRRLVPAGRRVRPARLPRAPRRAWPARPRRRCDARCARSVSAVARATSSSPTMPRGAHRPRAAPPGSPPPAHRRPRAAPPALRRPRGRRPAAASRSRTSTSSCGTPSSIACRSCRRRSWFCARLLLRAPPRASRARATPPPAAPLRASRAVARSTSAACAALASAARRPITSTASRASRAAAGQREALVGRLPLSLAAHGRLAGLGLARLERTPLLLGARALSVASSSALAGEAIAVLAGLGQQRLEADDRLLLPVGLRRPSWRSAASAARCVSSTVGLVGQPRRATSRFRPTAPAAP